MLGARLGIGGLSRASRRWRVSSPRLSTTSVFPERASAAAVSRLALESDAVGVCVKPLPREHRRLRALRTTRAVPSSASSETPSESYLETASRPSRFEESSWGDPEAVEVLLQAMRIQWSHGYPDTPRGYDRLTHGFHEYPAGMQAAAADRCLDCLPGTSLLDPFCGGGTSLVVGMTRGYAGFGVDVSPLATFVAAHRAWRPVRGDETLDAMREITRTVTETAEMEKAAARLLREEEKAEREKGDEARVAAKNSRGGGGAGAVPRDWRPVLLALSACLSRGSGDDDAVDTAMRSLVATAEPGVPGALRFCLSVALQRSQKGRGKRRPYKRRRKKNAEKLAETSANGNTESSLTPGQLEAATQFRNVVDEYCGRVSGLVRAVDADLPRATIYNQDVRDARLPTRVDAVLTSPPYPGVYDYLSFARKVRAGSGNATTATTAATTATTAATAMNATRSSSSVSAVAVKPPNATAAASLADVVPGSEGYFAAAVPEDRAWPAAWTQGEIGARKTLRCDPHAFKARWQAEQEGWLSVVASSLKPGGRAAVMVGDGANIDTRASVLAAGEACGLVGIATVTMALTHETEDGRVWNAARKEHLVLLEKPSSARANDSVGEATTGA